jgi:hypothetical protein
MRAFERYQLIEWDEDSLQMLCAPFAGSDPNHPE